MKTTTPATFVLTDRDQIFVQLPDETSFGFSLHDDDQSWPGGIGAASSWTAISADDPRITPEIHERLDHLLDEDSPAMKTTTHTIWLTAPHIDQQFWNPTTNRFEPVTGDTLHFPSEADARSHFEDAVRHVRDAADWLPGEYTVSIERTTTDEDDSEDETLTEETISR